MEKLREIIDRCTWIKARPHADLQSEILNVIAAPLYMYTITGVFYYSVFFIMPYYYETTTDAQNETWALFFQRTLLLIVYFQMMLNWLCIRLVDNSMKTAINSKHFVSKQGNYQGNQSDLNRVVVNGTNQPKVSRYNNRTTTLPGPQAAPPAPARVSYWSWKYCTKCELTAPPRCHHCPFCANCILKRDHHCFFTRRCIGFYNQRHFVVFLVWAAFGTSYTSLYFVPYFFQVILVQVSLWDIFAPFAFIRALTGYGSFHVANVMLTFTMNILFVSLSSSFIHEQYQLISNGITQFEQTKVDRRRLVISDPRPFTDKLKSVLGCYYGVSLVFPCAHLLFPPHENPFEWPGHKIYRK